MKDIIFVLIPLILSIALVANYDPIFASHGGHHDESMGQHGMKENMIGNHHTSYKGMCGPGFVDLDGMCVLDDRCGPGAYPGKMCMMDGMIKQYLRPHHQKYAGITAENIICAEGKHLMFKHQDATPACMNSNSVEKLKHRGWQTEMPPIACTMEYNPVCGVDDVTYGNMCGLNAQHMAMNHHGECESPMKMQDDTKSEKMEITTDINKITELNWLDPENRNLGFRNMDKFVQFPHEISKGSGPVHEFGSNPHDLSDIKVEYFDEVMPFEEWLEKSHTDAILVLKGNDIVYEKYLRMDPNERHSIQSISKTIVPALLGDSVVDGDVDLNKKMKEYIPNIGSGYAEATFQQVLNMDVSNDYDGNFDNLNSDAYKYETGAGWKPDVENKWPEGHRGFIKSITSDDVTGSGVSQYQDPNTDSSAWVIEEISGEKYYDLFEKNIYYHLGAEQDAMINLDNQDNAFAAGGWQMSLRDLARYATVWMNDGIAPDGERVISAEWIDELRDTTKGVPYKGYEKYNVTYHNQMTTDGTFLAHAGWGGQFLYADPDNKVSYVIFSSLTTPGGQTIEDLTTMYEFGLAISEYFSE